MSRASSSSHESPASRVDSPLAAHDRFIVANNVRLHYLEWGDADNRPLVLLHGASAHAHWWDFFATSFVDRYRVLALDLRGHGDSQWSTSRNYDLESHAADVGAFLAALNVRGAVLVGHSFGGFVSILYGSQAGNRLAALVSIDNRARIGQRSARYMNTLRKLPHPVYASAEEAVRRFRLFPAATAARPEVLAHVARHGIRQTNDGTWTLRFDRWSMASTQPRDLSAALAKVGCPILVVRGQHSGVLPAAALAEFLRAAPAARTVEIADAHHHVMLDQPEALAREVDRFLRAALENR